MKVDSFRGRPEEIEKKVHYYDTRKHWKPKWAEIVKEVNRPKLEFWVRALKKPYETHVGKYFIKGYMNYLGPCFHRNRQVVVTAIWP